MAGRLPCRNRPSRVGMVLSSDSATGGRGIGDPYPLLWPPLDLRPARPPIPPSPKPNRWLADARVQRGFSGSAPIRRNSSSASSGAQRFPGPARPGRSRAAAFALLAADAITVTIEMRRIAGIPPSDRCSPRRPGRGAVGERSRARTAHQRLGPRGAAGAS